MLLHPVLLLDIWQIILYIATILVALISVAALGALSLLVVQLRSLVHQIRGEITSVLGQARQTLTAVEGATEFVSAGLVKPAIGVVSIAAGVARTLAVLRSSVVRPHAGRLRRGD